ncbi:hypothetical protein [Thiothrix subterranea]|uniref:Uncharacterized protein n=1 Tax=Thiothrix subterranea TaxID=2735563 RepID=A0AA51MN27_9GAMM|nr:hypothetical protein [Thiothrix subterranea]WML86293.1 hypothetical protein RCG00_18615 [Thiothrix subterranea]WML87387.1 hypothetical protein RCG00_03285 [Thiothrix subterranea]
MNMEQTLLNDILLPTNLHPAWKHVRQNKGSAGIDGITLDAYPDWAKAHWQTSGAGCWRVIIARSQSDG